MRYLFPIRVSHIKFGPIFELCKITQYHITLFTNHCIFITMSAIIATLYANKPIVTSGNHEGNHVRFRT